MVGDGGMARFWIAEGHMVEALILTALPLNRLPVPVTSTSASTNTNPIFAFSTIAPRLTARVGSHRTRRCYACSACRSPGSKENHRVHQRFVSCHIPSCRGGSYWEDRMTWLRARCEATVPALLEGDK